MSDMDGRGAEESGAGKPETGKPRQNEAPRLRGREEAGQPTNQTGEREEESGKVLRWNALSERVFLTDDAGRTVAPHRARRARSTDHRPHGLPSGSADFSWLPGFLIQSHPSRSESAIHRLPTTDYRSPTTDRRLLTTKSTKSTKVLTKPESGNRWRNRRAETGDRREGEESGKVGKCEGADETGEERPEWSEWDERHGREGREGSGEEAGQPTNQTGESCSGRRPWRQSGERRGGWAADESKRCEGLFLLRVPLSHFRTFRRFSPFVSFVVKSKGFATEMRAREDSNLKPSDP